LQFLLENGKKRFFSYKVACKKYHGQAKGGASHRALPPKYATASNSEQFYNYVSSDFKYAQRPL